MLHERTTIASAARLIGETLQSHYATDPLPVYKKAAIDPSRLDVAGARYPWASMQKLWVEAAKATGDPCMGLTVGRNIRPTTFHALGFSWLVSQTLLGSLERLCRYHRVISTAPLELSIKPVGDQYIFSANLNDPAHVPTDAAVDAFTAAFVQMCRKATDRHFHPVSITLRRADPGHLDEYIRFFECPVHFDAEQNLIHFDREPSRGKPI